MKTGFLSVMIMSFAVTAGAQNLVRNPSFEEATGCPKQVSSIGQQLRVDDWSKPNTASSDYFNSCNSTPETTGVPANYMGTEAASDGEGYVGIVVGIDDEYSEYVQGRLYEPLVKGERYTVKFKVSLAETSNWASSHMGCVFTKKRITSTNYERVIRKTDLQFTEVIDQTEGWKQLEFEYVAEGGEHYFTLGCFADKSEMESRKMHWSAIKIRSQAYYYIDDVSVEQVKDIVVPEPTVAAVDTFTLGDLCFESGSYELAKSQLADLDSLCAELKQSKRKIEIIGHTDSSGPAKENVVLSKRRAKAVANYLNSKGIVLDRISTKGRGSAVPKAPNDNAENKALNRRVEIVIL